MPDFAVTRSFFELSAAPHDIGKYVKWGKKGNNAAAAAFRRPSSFKGSSSTSAVFNPFYSISQMEVGMRL